MAWLNITAWTPTLITQHGFVTGKEEGNAVIGTFDHPTLILDGQPLNWVRRVTRQKDSIVRYEFRGLTLAAADLLIAFTGMNTITHDPDGRVTYKSEASHGRVNDANGFTVYRTTTNTSYSFATTPITGQS